jgi:hypothetical protein
MIDVSDGSDAYSISLAGLGAGGLAGFTPDPSWADHVSLGTFNPDPQYGGPFYALSDSGVEWMGPGPVTHAFSLLLASSTVPGTYDLTFTVAGSGDEGRWRDSNPFQLIVVPEVVCIPGDTSPCDGRVNLGDLNAVRNNFGRSGEPGLPGDAFPFDGMVTLNDLNGVRNNFGAGPGASPVPEPSAVVLTLLGVAAAGPLVRRTKHPSAAT